MVVYHNVKDIVKDVDFDVLVTGPDQTHEGFQEAMNWCRANGKKVTILPRTEGISSTDLKELIRNM